jgi:DNA-binding transcriptional ArsR family regulator
MPDENEEELLAFVRGSVRSVWALELLLLMRRSRGRTWSADELVRELRASVPLVSQVLTAFTAAGLVHDDGEGRVVYAPASEALNALVGRLEDLYRERPVAVINLIVGASSDKLQSFADAFRLRGDKP